MKDSKNQEVWAMCHLAGDASGQDWTIMSSGESGLQIAMVRRRTDRKRSRILAGSLVWADLAAADGWAKVLMAFRFPVSCCDLGMSEIASGRLTESTGSHNSR